MDVSMEPGPGVDGRHQVRLRGDLDLAAEDQVLTAVGGLMAATAAASSTVVLDCSEVTFADSSGIRALVRLHRDHGGRLVLARLSPSLHRVLEIAGLLPLFEAAEASVAGVEASVAATADGPVATADGPVATADADARAAGPAPQHRG